MVVGILPIWRLAPNVTTANTSRVRIEQNILTVKAVDTRHPFFHFIKGAVHAESVLDILVIQIEDNHAKYISNPEITPGWLLGYGLLEQAAERYFDQGFGGAFLEQHQDAVISVLGKDREIYPIRHVRSAKWIRPARPEAIALIYVCWVDVNTLHAIPYLTTHLFDGALDRIISVKIAQKSRKFHGFLDLFGQSN